MEYRFEFAPAMVARANARHDWVAEKSPDRADKWYRGLFERIETLKSHPTRYPSPRRGVTTARNFAISPTANEETFFEFFSPFEATWSESCR